jgi:Zyg-11 family protein
MLDSPLPLREYCLEYLRESLSVTCCLKDNQLINQTIDENNININNDSKNFLNNSFNNNFNKILINNNSNNGLNHKKNELLINGNLTEELLEKLSANNQLTDNVLLMSIFDSEVTQLRSVRIPDASHMTTRGLRALKTHRINELEVCGLVKCTINELIGCLGEWSLMRLKSLNVSYSSFTSSNKVSILHFFCFVFIFILDFIFYLILFSVEWFLKLKKSDFFC